MNFSNIIRNSEDRNTQKEVGMAVYERNLITVYRKYLLRTEEVVIHLPLIIA